MIKTTSGFTIIELIVVVTVIAILTALGVYSFGRVQSNSRDSQRSSKIILVSGALEKYYNAKGEYPSCADMAQPIDTISTSILIGLRADAMTTPTDPIGTNSILTNCADIPTGYTSDKFAYIGINNTNCLTSPCFKWTLKYREETTGNIISLDSLQTTIPTGS